MKKFLRKKNIKILLGCSFALICAAVVFFVMSTRYSKAKLASSEVLQKKISQIPNNFNKIVVACSNESGLTIKESCWTDALAKTLKDQGLDKAFDLFTVLYDSEPNVPKSCHGWTHVLGKAAFDLYDKDKSLILRKEVSYCGYGFFHGFMERLIQSTGDLKQAKDFCSYASSQLGQNARGTYQNCIHGIGHGSVDIDNPALFGNFQAMANSGIVRCEPIFTDSEELSLCLDGVFNSMEQNTYLSEYGLKLNSNDLYYYCRLQKPQYKDSCYTQFTGLMEDFTNHDFKKSIQIIEAEHLPTVISSRVYKKLGADIIQYSIVDKDQLSNVQECRSLSSENYDSCIHGLVTGFISHGEPGKEYVKALEFCESDYLTDSEKNTCYKPVLQQLISHDSTLCLSVPEKYRKYCY